MFTYYVVCIMCIHGILYEYVVTHQKYYQRYDIAYNIIRCSTIVLYYIRGAAVLPFAEASKRNSEAYKRARIKKQQIW